MRLTDEELSALLGQALDPGAPIPPPESVSELRRLVVGAAPRRSGPLLRSRAAVAAAVFFGVSGSALGAAVASGATLPEPLRAVANGIGLPVDSVGLAQAKAAAGRLRGALDHGDVGAVPRDAAALQSSFASLGTGDRRSIDGEVDFLLDRAAPYDGKGSGATSGTTTERGAPISGDSDDGTATSTTVPGSRTSGGDGDAAGGDRSDGGASPTTATTAPPSTSGGSTSPTTTATDGGGGDGGGGDGGGGTDGGSVSGSDGGG